PPARYTEIRGIPGEGWTVRAPACNAGGAVGTDTQPAAATLAATRIAARSMSASWVEGDGRLAPNGSDEPRLDRSRRESDPARAPIPIESLSRPRGCP